MLDQRDQPAGRHPGADPGLGDLGRLRSHMDRIRIRGGSRLKGEIPISGAKNAALPLMAACLLTDETLRLGNLPHVADITTMANLLAQLGVEVHLNGHASNGGHDGRVLELTARQITETRAPYDLVRKMRASVLVLGPLVARYGRAEVSLPGGCAIGTRPIDLHLQGLRQLGRRDRAHRGLCHRPRAPGADRRPDRLPEGLRGRDRESDAGGDACPRRDGAGQCGAGAGDQRSRPLPAEYGRRYPGPGHATACASAGVEPPARAPATRRWATASRRAPMPWRRRSPMARSSSSARASRCWARSPMRCAAPGWRSRETNRGLKVQRANGELRGVDVMTEPFPGFATDLQAQMMATMATAQGPP